MTDSESCMDMGDFIDSLNSYDLESPLKIRVGDEEAQYVNHATVHAYGGDYYEMAFSVNTGAKHGEISPVRELVEKLEDYCDSSMGDYGGIYWHDSSSLLYFADYGESSNLRVTAVEQDENGIVTIAVSPV